MLSKHRRFLSFTYLYAQADQSEPKQLRLEFFLRRKYLLANTATYSYFSFYAIIQG